MLPVDGDDVNTDSGEHKPKRVNPEQSGETGGEIGMSGAFCGGLKDVCGPGISALVAVGELSGDKLSLSPSVGLSNVFLDLQSVSLHLFPRMSSIINEFLVFLTKGGQTTVLLPVSGKCPCFFGSK